MYTADIGFTLPYTLYQITRTLSDTSSVINTVST